MLHSTILAFVVALPLQGDRDSPIPKANKTTTVTLRLEKAAAIKGLDILLGDIAQIVGKEPNYTKYLGQVRISSAPTGRFARWITKHEIRQALRLAKLNPDDLDWTGATRVEVYAARTLVLAQDIIKTANTVIRALFKEEGEKDAQWRMNSRVTDIAIPVPRVGKELVARFPSGKLGRATALVVVDILVDGKKIKQVPISFRLQRFRRVLVALKSIRAGDEFLAANVTTKRIDIASAAHPAHVTPLTLHSQTRDRVARGPIRVGKIIYETDLAMPNVISKGDLVTVIAVAGRVRVTTRGIARKSGAVGQRIPVIIQNQKSNIPVEGIAYGTGIVIVKIGAFRNLPAKPAR